VNVVTQVFAVLAGALHVGIFAMESLLFRRPPVQQAFGASDELPLEVDLWAFNQGFYNLFLAAGAIGGVVAAHTGHPVAGRAVTLFACACMVAAAIVLLTSTRGRLIRGALLQGTLPLIALLAALA
jgi:putative membrane protein